MALCESGSRAPRGRAEAAEDHFAQKCRLVEQARQQAEARQTADELRRASGRSSMVSLSAPAMRLLQDLVTTALGNAQLHKDAHDFHLDGTQATDADRDIWLTAWRTPGKSMALKSVDGDLTTEDLTVADERVSEPAVREVSA